jgi:hypothetical protein
MDMVTCSSYYSFKNLFEDEINLPKTENSISTWKLIIVTAALGYVWDGGRLGERRE